MAGSAPELTPLITDESRLQERTHLFVAATLHGGGSSCPVHIRNMSPGGALIEGAVLPEQDEATTLRRGRLQASAKVVWKAGRKVGVAFSSIIHVADWMSRNVPSHQGQVDDAARNIHAGLDAESGPAGDRASDRAGSTLETELQALRAELAELEHGLIGDAVVVATHPEIQLFDIARQRVERLLASPLRR